MYSGDSRPKDPMAAVLKKQRDESEGHTDSGNAQVLKWASLLACFLLGGSALKTAYGLVTYLGRSS